MGTTIGLAFVVALVAREASAQTRPPPDLACRTIENALDCRSRPPNLRAHITQLIGAARNPRRVSVGFGLRVRGAERT